MQGVRLPCTAPVRAMRMILSTLLLGAQANAHAGVDAPATESIVIAATNDFRAAEGRGRLKRDAKLDDAARKFAVHMARTDRFDHDADGRKPGERARAAGYVWCAIAENIAYEYRSSGFATRELAETFVEDWKNSAGHRLNLLDRNLADIGVGVAQSRRTGHWYGVQLFGRKCR